MLQLDDSLTVGKGANRTVYVHPSDENKCIKISNSESSRTQALESAYYKALESTAISWAHISRFYGEIETNLGEGYVYELVRDFNQTISLPLSNYLSSVPATNIKIEIILESLAELKNYLIKNKIIVRNLRPYNIVFKRMNSNFGRMVIIDNIGHHNNCFHLSDHVSFLARKDIHKKWNKFELSIQNTDVFKL